MHATKAKGVEQASYQIKDMANVWYNKQEGSRGKDAKPVVQDEFKEAFMNNFFPWDLMKAKVFLIICFC